MSEFKRLDADAPATLEAVVEAVAHLSTLDEAQILEIVSAGKLREHFAFRPNRIDDELQDSVAEEDLVEASPLPLSRQQRANLIQASMPSRSSDRSKSLPAFAKKLYSEG